MKRLRLFNGVSAASSQQTVWVGLGDSTFYNIGILITGTDVVGSLSIQATSGTDDPNNSPSGLVATVAGSTRAVTASADVIYDGSSGTGMNWIRLDWVYTSGTGNITAWIEIKEKQE